MLGAESLIIAHRCADDFGSYRSQGLFRVLFEAGCARAFIAVLGWDANLGVGNGCLHHLVGLPLCSSLVMSTIRLEAIPATHVAIA